MLKIKNVEIAFLESSIKASGYPLSIKTSDLSDNDNNLLRAKRLGRAISGSGHDCFLKGITVTFDVTFGEYWSPQFQRYHFADIVSSQSKMHRITKFNIADSCNKYVSQEIIQLLEDYKKKYNEAKTSEDKYYYFMCLISNLPMGFEKTMRIVTNYLQLKTIYLQRKNHKLKEDWGVFCKWILTLPKFKELTGIEYEKN